MTNQSDPRRTKLTIGSNWSITYFDGHEIFDSSDVDAIVASFEHSSREAYPSLRPVWLVRESELTVAYAAWSALSADEQLTVMNTLDTLQQDAIDRVAATKCN